MSEPIRCTWCPPEDELYAAYHDEEWGVPVRDGLKLFEMLNLEGAQAGLSWRTILGRRANYYEVFDGFDPMRLSKWTESKIQRALKNPGIIRNRLKVRGVVRNAQSLREYFGSDLDAFSKFLWNFVNDQPVQNDFNSGALPASTTISDFMSKELKKRGFTFVGSTICYAFMQAVGMVNDHAPSCFRREPVKLLAK